MFNTATPGTSKRTAETEAISRFELPESRAPEPARNAETKLTMPVMIKRFFFRTSIARRIHCPNPDATSTGKKESQSAPSRRPNALQAKPVQRQPATPDTRRLYVGDYPIRS